MQSLNRFTASVTVGILALAIGATPSLAHQKSTSSNSNIANSTSATMAEGAAVQRLNLSGIGNFARVSDTLYRGAQPSEVAYDELKNLGVGVVVDFRDERDEIAKEKTRVEGAGMEFISLPWSGRSLPTHEEVATFLNLMHNTKGKKVFVHCKEGRDRTGTMVALYRMTFDHWTVTQAVSEMNDFKYHHFFLPGLEEYVKAWPKALSDDPTFAAFVSSAVAPASATASVTH